MAKKSRSIPSKLLAGTALVLALGACSPTVDNRGNLLTQDEVATVRPGETTRQQLLQNFGSPSSIDAFDENTWYYIGRREERWAFLNPEVTDHRVVVVRMNEQGIVQNVRTIGIEETRDIEVVERTTPTRGQEPSLVQSLYQMLITGPVQTLNRAPGEPRDF